MDVNDIQRHVLGIVKEWVRQNPRHPIPQRVIVEQITIQLPLMPQSTVKAAVRVLVRKGYIRKAVSISNSACYVQLRSL